MVLSSNFGNVISVFIASLTLPYLPMLPFQLILQNLLYDLSQTTMPFDNVDTEDIQRPQVFKLKNLIIFMLFFGPISSIFDVATFGYFYFYYGIKTADDERVLLFQTGWFTVGLLTQSKFGLASLVIYILIIFRAIFLLSNFLVRPICSSHHAYCQNAQGARLSVQRKYQGLHFNCHLSLPGSYCALPTTGSNLQDGQIAKRVLLLPALDFGCLLCYCSVW